MAANMVTHKYPQIARPRGQQGLQLACGSVLQLQMHGSL